MYSLSDILKIGIFSKDNKIMAHPCTNNISIFLILYCTFCNRSSFVTNIFLYLFYVVTDTSISKCIVTRDIYVCLYVILETISNYVRYFTIIYAV